MLTQQIWSVLIFLACLAALPYLVKRWKTANLAREGETPEAAPRIVSALAVGPQQRVVVIELGKEGARRRMVLGVTQQNIACLISEPVDANLAAQKADNIGSSAAVSG